MVWQPSLLLRRRFILGQLCCNNFSRYVPQHYVLPVRCLPRMRWCSRCPTRVRQSGTWHIRPGFSKRSFSPGNSTDIRSSIPNIACYSIRITKLLGAIRCGNSGERFRGRRSATCLRYRAHVDEAMHRLLHSERSQEVLALVELGIHHEQQHQELILTDILHAFWTQPLRPAYAPALEEISSGASETSAPARTALRWIAHLGGTEEIGAADEGFAFDNERPRHAALLLPYRLASRLVTNAEYLEFIDDKGYQRPELWLSDGWDTVCREGWQAPLYWESADEGWRTFSLHGVSAVDPAAPVTPRELLRGGCIRPLVRRAASAGERMGAGGQRIARSAGNLLEGWSFECASMRSPRRRRRSAFGDCWEWTASAYLAYPGFRPGTGRGRRVQRKVHVQSVRPARRIVRHLCVAPSRILSQFLSAPCALAIHGHQAGKE